MEFAARPSAHPVEGVGAFWADRLPRLSCPVRGPADNLRGQNDHIADSNLQTVPTSLYCLRRPQIDLVTLVGAVRGQFCSPANVRLTFFQYKCSYEHYEPHRSSTCHSGFWPGFSCRE